MLLFVGRSSAPIRNRRMLFFPGRLSWCISSFHVQSTASTCCSTDVAYRADAISSNQLTAAATALFVVHVSCSFCLDCRLMFCLYIIRYNSNHWFFYHCFLNLGLFHVVHLKRCLQLWVFI